MFAYVSISELTVNEYLRGQCCNAINDNKIKSLLLEEYLDYLTCIFPTVGLG